MSSSRQPSVSMHACMHLENRNQEVRDLVAQLLLFHKQNKILLATSVFNVAELVDGEFQICFIGACVNERMSYDEIISKLRGNRKLYREIAKKNKAEIERKIKAFVFENGIEAFSVSFDDPQKYEEIYRLIYDYQLRLQDALIVAAALTNRADYFLSNDSDLVSAISDLINCYNLRDRTQHQSFQDDVLQAI